MLSVLVMKGRIEGLHLGLVASSHTQVLGLPRPGVFVCENINLQPLKKSQFLINRLDFCSERLKGLLLVLIGRLLMAPAYSMAAVLRTLKSQHLFSKRVVLPLEEHERHSR